MDYRDNKWLPIAQAIVKPFFKIYCKAAEAVGAVINIYGDL